MPLDDFKTDRLAVRNWSAELADPVRRGTLETELGPILTPPVLAHLPRPLQLGGSPDALSDWVSDRAAESDVAVIVEVATTSLIGLLILATEEEAVAPRTVHLGYLFAEWSWGKGYASELLAGLVTAAQQDGQPLKLVGGVGKDNPASARVLQKAGFTIDTGASTSETEIFVRTLA